ncbi:MAG: glycine cleavage system protein GcvH [Deltaproteobacteria bacterium]|nr:glycine cleavage system protein GcvH [Deltaproteobacteria bacterium]
MANLAGYKFAKEHEWLVTAGEDYRLGISDYAQKELGDVVYVDLPQVGKQIKRGESFMTVESVKAVSDIFAPVDGVVVAVNTALSAQPELVNKDPYEGGWVVIIKAADIGQVSEMMEASAYEDYIAGL